MIKFSGWTRMNRVRNGPHTVAGFTLIEIAIVLFIFGLLVAGLLGPLETQLEARDRKRTIDALNEVTEALYGYAIANGRLPCPDSDGDGLSDMETEPFDPGDATSANCDGGSDFVDGEGFLPWVELGVPDGDAWGNRFRYRVRAPQFTWPDSNGVCDGDSAAEFDLCTSGDVVVRTRADDPTTANIEGKFSAVLANNLPAIVISHGRNGFGATATSGIQRPAPSTGTDEAENTNGDMTFYSRIYTGEGATCADGANEAIPRCAFDDIVKWISPTVLINRMVTAGRLP